MITEDYVSFKTAKLLKEKGFDGECDLFGRTDESGKIIREASKIAYSQGIDDECIILPTLQMAMKWLRKEHNLSVRPRYDEVEDEKEHLYYVWFFDILSMNPYKTLVEPTQGYFTYEEACEAAIKHCLENLI